MKDGQDDITLIESYLLGRINKDSERQLLERLKTDAEFKKLFDELKQLIEGVQQVSSNDTLKTIQGFENKILDKKSYHVSWYLKIAASVLFLAVSLYLIFHYTENYNNSLFEKYHTTYPNQISPLTRSKDQPDQFKEKAYYAYDLGNYEDAIDLLGQISIEEDDGASLFYIGLSYLELKQPDKAIRSFQTYLSSFDIFNEEARFYLSLAYLLNGSSQLAEDQLLLTDTIKYSKLLKEIRLKNQ
nr:tetratricopeptide repeat protein [Fulvivirga aurantia]